MQATQAKEEEEDKVRKDQVIEDQARAVQGHTELVKKRIPKIIHHMWLNPKDPAATEPPAKYSPFVASFKRMNPEFQFEFWNYDRVISLIKDCEAQGLIFKLIARFANLKTILFGAQSKQHLCLYLDEFAYKVRCSVEEYPIFSFKWIQLAK